MTAVYLMAACIMGCKEPSTTKIREKKSNLAPPETDTMIAMNDTIEPVMVTSWQQFEHYNGQYITETDMMQKEPLKRRLELLLGKEEEEKFTQRFEVTPPIEITDHIIYNQGCRKHYCGSDEAAIAVDMDKDLIYVGIAVNGIVKLYSEKEDKGYPEKLLKWKQKFEN